MTKRTCLNVLLIAGVTMVTSLSAHASAGVLPFLQRSECSAASGWTQSENTGLNCSGNVLLAGGTWESESAIVVRADGLLWLSDVRITAPSIDLQAGSLRIDSNATLSSSSGSISLATNGAAVIEGTIFAGGSVVAGSGAGMVLLPGGSIVLSPVPEPETLVMWLAGLVLLSARRRSEARVQRMSSVA